MPGALTNGQKRTLAEMSARAFRFLGAQARGRGEAWPEETTRALAEWRHQQVQAACQKAGLRCCTQDDYAAVKAHFQNQLGQPDKALSTLVHGEDQKRRQAEAVLWREMEKAGFQPAYVNAICRAQFKCSVLEASAGQLWKLVFTVRNRARARRATA